MVPSPRVKPAEAPLRETPPAAPQPVTAGPAPPSAPRIAAAWARILAAAPLLGAKLSSVLRPDRRAGLADLARRRGWILALPLAAAGGFAAWQGIGGAPDLAIRPPGEAPSASQASEQAADLSAAAPQPPEAGIGRPQPGPSDPRSVEAAGRTASDSPAPPPAVPAGTAAGPLPPDAASMPYSLIVLHPRPASATANASNDRVAALLQPLTARLEMQKKAGTKGRLTVHYFHREDAEAARALADRVRTPGGPVQVRGPVRTRAPWPRNAFEVWLRGP